jgi:hypothetical protein
MWEWMSTTIMGIGKVQDSAPKPCAELDLSRFADKEEAKEKRSRGNNRAIATDFAVVPCGRVVFPVKNAWKQKTPIESQVHDRLGALPPFGLPNRGDRARATDFAVGAEQGDIFDQ